MNPQKEYLDVIKGVYRRFLDKKNSHKHTLRIKPISNGALSAVFYINSNIVGKVAKVNYKNAEKKSAEPFLQNKETIWNFLGERISLEENENVKDVLRKLVSLPIYKGFEQTTNGKYLVSLEPLIRGKTFARCILDGDRMSADFKSSDENFFKVFYILFDILLYLGETYKFNHNDLHFENVMIVEAKAVDLCEYRSLYLGNITLRDVKYIPIILDFDWATITGLQSTSDEMKQYYKFYMTETCSSPDVSHFCKTHTKYGYKETFYSNWSSQIDTAMFLGMFDYTILDKQSNLFKYLEMVKEGTSLNVEKLSANGKLNNLRGKIITEPYNIHNAFYVLHALDMFVN